MHLLVEAGTPAPNFASAGPAESAVYMDHISKNLRAARRTALEHYLLDSDDDKSSKPLGSHEMRTLFF